MTDYNLYSYWRSSCSWRVRWAMELKGISHTITPVNLLKSEQFGEEYTTLNPNSRLPTLAFDGHTISGSLPIIDYLEEKHPEKPLYPNDLLTKAKVRELVNIIACDTQPIQNLAVMKYYSEDMDKRKAYAKHWITRGLEAYETVASKVAGTYSVGGIITAADICLIPQVYNAKRFGVDLDKFPTVKRIWEACMSLDSCKKAAPEQQIDAVKPV